MIRWFYNYRLHPEFVSGSCEMPKRVQQAFTYGLMRSRNKFWVTFLCILLLILPIQAKASGNSDLFPWMNASISNLSTIFSSCLTVPSSVDISSGSKTFNLATNTGQWVPVNTTVQQGKLLKINLNSAGIHYSPRKYLVMYRVDPRFAQPQVFIQTYDYTQQKYISDFHQFKSGKLVQYQTSPYPALTQAMITDYNDYFSFSGRSQIPVYQGDVVNITFATAGDFFSSNNGFTQEFNDTNSTPSIIYTVVPTPDNEIIYATAAPWCQTLGIPANQCSNDLYNNTTTLPTILLGKPSEPKFSLMINNVSNPIPSCADGLNTNNLSSLCVYDKGRGMNVTINGQIIKSEKDSFIHSSFTNKDFLYYESSGLGNIQFLTSWQIAGMFSSFNQFMSSWGSILSTPGLTNYISSSQSGLAANFLHFGRYIMLVEIGKGSNSVSFQDQNAISASYIISNTTPNSSDTGTSIGTSYKGNASASGNLYIRVDNPNSDLQGNVTVNYENYTGSTIFSDIVYGDIIIPLRNQFNNMTKIFYNKLIINSSLRNIAKAMLFIYVAMYGLFFLAGATKITVQDIVSRVVKIAIVVALFKPTSWDFFNNNLFNVFISGTDYLMSSVIGISSSTNNVFTFIDPIFSKYTNPKVWALLFIQLLQIQNGLTFFAIMTMIGIIFYFRAVLEIIVGYCLAFVGLSVMISLAPFFIVFILFERTRGFFYNWLSTLFNYAVQPTILLVFFLLIEQIIATPLLQSITQACWQCLVNLQINITIDFLKINTNFSIPWLPCIPFYVTIVNPIANASDLLNSNGTFLSIAAASFLFYSYCLMAYGLVGYVTNVVASLTNVAPARIEGKYRGSDNPTASVIQDIKGAVGFVGKPIASAAYSPIRAFKDKVIDQNFKAKSNNANKNNNSGQKEEGGSSE